MKSNKEILNKAINLLCLSDRSALEKKSLNGVKYSVSSRENQRKLIISWLIKNDLYSSMSQNEQNFIETKVGKLDIKEVNYYQLQYECIQPLLWILGLVNEVSKYDNFVIDDFHLTLKMNDFNQVKILNEIENKKRNIKQINTKRLISMLWFWRLIEINNNAFHIKSAEEIIISVFGKDFKHIVEEMKILGLMRKDFIVNDIEITQLPNDVINRLKVVSQFRYHSFEWVFSDMSWEEVEINT